MKVVFDIECDGLIEDATKIHCLCYHILDTDTYGSFSNYDGMRAFLLQEDLTLIGHNIICYDIPMLNKFLEIEIKAILIDTLPLSWTLYSQRFEHGLESWGETLGIHKPEIKDWKNLSVESYIHRATEDVRINVKLWKRLKSILDLLYRDESEINRYIQYLSFKMDCMREQEEIGIKLDVTHCEKMLHSLSTEKDSKVEQLKTSMPLSPVKIKETYENALEDKDGNIFQKGDLFFSSVETQANVSSIEREKIVRYEEPNPNSSSQIKDWLFSLGWEPETFKHVKDKNTEEIKKIPQVSLGDSSGEVCHSVKKLFDVEPSLEILNGLSVLSHRISLFKGFLKQRKEDRLYARCSGLTNTLRFQHSVIVNLPGVDKKYGHDVRASLIADEGKILCGCDLSAIEDSTKRHYIYFYDPQYVEEMNIPGYDPHLDIAKLAGFLTEEDVILYKELDKRKDRGETLSKEEVLKFSNLKKIRARAKTLNFAATYKCGISTLSRNSKISLKEAKELLQVYWKRNEAILKIEKSLKVRELFDQKWLLNPISGFWYSLRAEKDRFSTLNQGTAVYVFDTWLKYIRAQGVKVAYQCHDEWLANISSEGYIIPRVNKAIEQVNKQLKLNVKIGCSIALGKDYASCH
jgi:hypothetical protein